MATTIPEDVNVQSKEQTAPHASDFGKTGKGDSTSGGVNRQPSGGVTGGSEAQKSKATTPANVDSDMSETQALREQVASAGELAGEAEADAQAFAMNNQREQIVPAAVEAAAASAAVDAGRYSLEQLQHAHKGGENELDIDFAHKENYLSDAEFQTLFKMARADFAKLPGWKQQSMKKSHKLF